MSHLLWLLVTFTGDFSAGCPFVYGEDRKMRKALGHRHLYLIPATPHSETCLRFAFGAGRPQVKPWCLFCGSHQKSLTDIFNIRQMSVPTFIFAVNRATPKSPSDFSLAVLHRGQSGRRGWPAEAVDFDFQTILSRRSRRASQSSLEKMCGPTSIRRGSMLKTETGVHRLPGRVRRPRLFNSDATRVME